MADGAEALPARPGACAPGASVYDGETAQAICARVAAGESLRAICREAGRPHRTTLAGWRLAHPEFAEALACAQATARLAARARNRAARLAAGRRPKPARGGRDCTYRPEIGRAICARLMAGESLTAIARDPAMPSYATVMAWVSRHPEFEDAYAAARAVQADWFFDEARDVALAARPGTVAADRLRFDVLRWQAAKLAPRKYLERVVVVDRQQALKLEAEAPRVHEFVISHYERAADGGLLPIPPRDAQEAARYEATFGEPFDAAKWRKIETRQWVER